MVETDWLEMIRHITRAVMIAAAMIGGGLCIGTILSWSRRRKRGTLGKP